MNMLDKDMEGHRPHPYWKTAHRDWKFWIVAMLMLALMIVYVMSDNFALRRSGQVRHSTPAEIAP